jgi:hypothetical protein
MKKTYLTFIAVFATIQFANAQWLSYGSAIYYTNGSVGIGSTAPQGNLEINNGSYSNGNQLIISGAEFARYYGSIQTTISAGATIFSLGVKSNFTNYLQTLNMVNGNVGIGTTTPGDLLDVNGNAVFGNSNERLSMGSGSLGFNRRVATGNIYNTANYAYQFQHTGNSASGSDYLALQVYSPSGSNITPNALTINGAAQVGINTSYISPGYQFAVNGSVQATSITVLSRGSWPDYVFKPAYTLPTLSEVKTYIDNNHHLPEIPSAEQIQKDGLNIGEINKLLVKKVEELTLYLIEKDRHEKKEDNTINELQQEVRQLKQQMQLLTKADSKKLSKKTKANTLYPSKNKN